MAASAESRGGVLYNIRMDMGIPHRPLFFTQLLAWKKHEPK